MSPPNPPDDDAVDPVDERLSAAIDGFGDAPDPPDPSTEPRARALVAARDALAAAPPALDELTRRRLVSTALVETPVRARTRTRTRGANRWAAPVAIAAAVSVIALGGWGLSRLGSSSSKQNAASGTASTTFVPPSPVALGDVSKPSVLLSRVRSALAAPPASAPAGDDGSASSRSHRCLDALGVTHAYVKFVLGTATFHGAAAVVIVARDAPRTLVYVLARADCRLLNAQFVRR